MVYNFSAGPSYIDPAVLENIDMSLIQQSHRDSGGPVQNMMVETQTNLRKLIHVPDNYHILFMHGGAHAQFSAIPLNLGVSRIGYVDTGQWSQKFAAEASKLCEVTRVAAHTLRFPYEDEWNVTEGIEYVHVCANETMTGIEMHHDIDTRKHTIIADFTSTLLSRQVDVSKYGVIYASSGKNLGSAGYCVVIARRDIVENVPDHTPSILSWKAHANSYPVQNIYNTPPVFAIHLSNEVMKHYLARGGIPEINKKVRRAAIQLYNYIDTSGGFYINVVSECSRSNMNVVFEIHDSSMEREFLDEAEKCGIFQIQNHPMAGGMRVTLYNMIPEDYVFVVTNFMEYFLNKKRIDV